jgi:hypothetical protein
LTNERDEEIKKRKAKDLAWTYREGTSWQLKN